MLIGGDNICSSPWRSNLKVFPCENRARNGARSIFCRTKTEKPVGSQIVGRRESKRHAKSCSRFLNSAGPTISEPGTGYLCTDAPFPVRQGASRSLSLLQNRMETIATQARRRSVKTSNKHTLLNGNYCGNVHKRERTKVA